MREISNEVSVFVFCVFESELKRALKRVERVLNKERVKVWYGGREYCTRHGDTFGFFFFFLFCYVFSRFRQFFQMRENNGIRDFDLINFLNFAGSSLRVRRPAGCSLQELFGLYMG